MANYKVALDAGHGGSDPGAVYKGRQEKDDALRLAMAVGDILEKNGVDVFYVRTTDEYETPFKKATDANNSGADLFVSIHRNSSESPNQYTGASSLVYKNSGFRSTVANNINAQLEKAGFKNLGIDERPNLVVLKRTQMPAVLVETGFINNDKDNALFDNNFNQIASAIANGILESIPKTMTSSAKEAMNSTDPSTMEANQNSNNNDNNRNNNDRNTSSGRNNTGITSRIETIKGDNMDNNDMYNMDDNNMNNNSMNARYPIDYSDEEDMSPEPLYRVQTGAYKNKDNADRMLAALQMDGFPAFIIYEDGYYKVQVGAYRLLTNAIKMERRLRKFRYNTYIVYN